MFCWLDSKLSKYKEIHSAFVRAASGAKVLSAKAREAKPEPKQNLAPDSNTQVGAKPRRG